MGRLLCLRLITIIYDDSKTIYFKMIQGVIHDSTTWKKHQQRIGQIIQESIVYSEKFRSGRLSKPVFSHFREKMLHWSVRGLRFPAPRPSKFPKRMIYSGIKQKKMCGMRCVFAIKM